MADLEEYRAKRRKGKTPEPLEGGGQEASKELVFVVQRHSARALHYDLRLERDGVLLSWALPRGVPLRAGERSLAVHVEDHPLDYADFEGDIPAGEYGGGTVEVWDRGTYELQRERPDGTLTVILHGRKLQGEWALVPARLGGEERNWLIVRAAKDGAAGPVQAYEPMLPRARPSASRAARAGRSSSPGRECARWRRSEGARGHFEHDRGRRARCALQAGARAHAARAAHERVRARWRDLRARRRGAAEPELLESGGGTVVYVVFDVLESRRSRCSSSPGRRAASGSRGCSTIASPSCASHAPTTTAARCAPPRGRGASASWPSGARRPTARAQVSDDWRLLRP